MKNNIGQISTTTTFRDGDPSLKISEYISASLRFYLTNYASDVGFQNFSGLWIICIDLIFHITPQGVV